MQTYGGGNPVLGGSDAALVADAWMTFGVARARVVFVGLKRIEIMRHPVFALAVCGLLLGACASPRAIGQGDVASMKGAAVAAYPGQADGEAATYARAVEGRVLSRLGAVASADKPSYLVQVGVAQPLPTVGVSSAEGALAPDAWRSSPGATPWWRLWEARGEERVVTLAVIDARDGRTLAWSSIRAKRETPTQVADRLVDAVSVSQAR